ncbi:MAG: 2-phospho-L-lactate transferase, partial [Terracoccus sp.]
ALRGTRAPVVGVSPLIGGRPVRGHADVCLQTIGVAATSEAVAGLYADFLDGWLVSPDDPMQNRPGLQVEHRPLLMSSIDAAADLAGAALDQATRITPGRTTA